MSTEKDWHVQKYAAAIHEYLSDRERKRFYYREQSPQLSERKRLVDWIGEVCERMEFCKTVHHLAIYYFDIFMDNHTIQADHLQMVALGCLSVAVKLEEKDSLIPKNSEFNVLMGNKYELKEFVHMEVTILNFFKWDILLPTTAHFVEYYALHALNPAEDIYKDEPISCNIAELNLLIPKYTEYFLDVTLQNVAFYEFYPSLIAAAVILSARLSATLKPAWPKSLKDITFYDIAQLKPCVEILLSMLEEDVMRKTGFEINSTFYDTNIGNLIQS